MTQILAKLLSKCIPAPVEIIATRIKTIFSELSKAFKSNIIPGIVVIVLAIVIAVLYDLETFLTFLLEDIAEIKYRLSYVYSFISTALFMGIIPWIFAVFRKRIIPGKRIESFLFMLIMYGLIGVQSDAFYRIQNSLFGDNGVKSIICKVLFDQFVWTLFYMSHINYWTNWIVTNNMANPQCSKQSIIKYLSYDWIVALLSGYIIWIPACSVIYWFQEDLQIIINNLIGCFFVIIMNTVTAAKASLSTGEEIEKQHVEDDDLNDMNGNDNDTELLVIETSDVINRND